MAYCTLEQVIARMGHPNSTSTNLEVNVADAITAAETAIDNLTGGRHFEPVTATKVFGVDCSTRDLWVPDLVSVTTLSLDENDDGSFETVIDAADFELWTHRQQAGWPYEVVRLTERDYPWGGNRRNRVEIVGSWGWAAVPATINFACSLLAGRLAQRASKALMGVESFGELGAAAIRSTDPDVAALLESYRIHGIA